MSFWKTVGHDLAIVGRDILAAAPVVGAVVGTVNPAAGLLITGLAGRINSAIVSVEQTITDEKAGVLKAQTVIADFKNGLSIAEEITGKTFNFDEAALQSAIDAQVAAHNAMGTFKQTIKQA